MNADTFANRAAWQPLRHLGVLRFSGPDAAAFLQGQVSNDTRRLGAGTPLLAAYSTPQGRVAALLHLLPHSSGILAVLPRELVLPTVERLRKYVLRSKLSIEDIGERFAVAGRLDASADAPPPLQPGTAYAEYDAIGVARVGGDPQRVWAVGDAAILRDHDFGTASIGTAGLGTAGPDAAAEHAWRLADIRAGLPQVYAATREMFVAQMLNLDRLDGISFTKGCFTGQEIIARTQHLGRIKRRLYRLWLPPGPWAIGQSLHLADGRSGRLTEVLTSDGACEALAVLTIKGGDATGTDSPEESTAAAEAPVAARELPLPYSLE